MARYSYFMVGAMPNQISTKSWLPSYLAAAVIWGLSFYFIEVLLTAFHPTVVTLIRLSVGAIILLAISVAMKLKLPFHLWRKLFFTAILMNSMPGFLFAFGQVYVSSILASMINAATPLFTLLFVILVFHEQKVTRNQIFGLVIGFLGVMVLLGVWQGMAPGQLIGVVAILLAATGYGFSLPYYRKHIIPLNYSPTALMALQIAIGAIQMAPFALINLELKADLSLHIIASALMLGGLGSGLAYVVHYRVTAIAGAAIASSVTYLTPVVAAVAGVFLLQEKLHWYEFAGAVVVIVGIVISQRQARRANA